MILIVDDKQENIFSLRTVLEKHGFETDAAQSGEEALKKLLKYDYALIILDVQMPVMDGFEVAEAVSGLNKTKDIPIIFLSAVNTHKRFITKGFESGAVDYLTKPVDTDILILKVQNFYRLFEKTQALKKAEKALQERVDELYITLESLPQIAFTANKKGEIEFVNKQWFEYSPRKFQFPETEENEESIELRWLEATQFASTIEFEVSIKKLEDNQYYHHLLKATPILSNGSVLRWVGTITNIHQQKMVSEELEKRVAERTDELLQINRQLEITNHDLQQFTFVASHDLKEPLRKIQFYSNLIKERAALEPSLENYLNKVLKSSERMSNLISDLLSFARLSQQELFEEADLNVIIDEIVQDLEISIKEKNAKIEVGSLPKLQVVPSLMRQLFQNIIMNSIKFAKPGTNPIITITAKRIGEPNLESPEVKNGNYCRLSIADNGIGFDDKYNEKIFTLFQRLNGREEYEGTGIGLAIAKKIVEKHHGFITAISKPGEGATFVVTLPVYQHLPVESNPSTTLINHK